MKNPLIKGTWMAAVAGVLFLAACSGTPEQTDTMDAPPDTEAVEAEANTFQEEQQDLMTDLRHLQEEFKAKLDEVNAELERTDLDEAVRAEAEATKARLEEAQTTVANELSNVEQATGDSWDDVKNEADKASQDLKGWWDGLKDQVEEATTTE